MSLHTIAPRLAKARDVERWNVWCAGDDEEIGIRDGERWAETVSAEHHAEACQHCGGALDRYVIWHRFLVGCNRGHVGRIESWKCRDCGYGRSSHR